MERVATPMPGAGEVLVRLLSIGMNHADLMARRGEYKISSGDPPFTPGLEGGGVIEATGSGVDGARIGQRVTLSPDAPRRAAGGMGGTYRSHYVVAAEKALPAPKAVPDEQLGALWLAYLTAWGCLVWRQQMKHGDYVVLPAASSSVALAAAQVVKKFGGVAIGLTTKEEKARKLKELETSRYDHVVVTHDADGGMKKWNRELKELTQGHGVDVFFDPVASGEYLQTEIRSLAMGGAIWVYGLLGEPGAVDVTPLIRLGGMIRGWGLAELIGAGEKQWRAGCEHIFAGFADGTYKQHVGGTFRLEDVGHAHEVMEQGGHIGKLVLLP